MRRAPLAFVASLASLLLVGADTVFRDGALINKVGTTILAEAAAAEKVPAPHGAQAEAPALEDKVPAAQGAQVEAPLPENLPGAQSTQEAWPVAAAKDPAAHGAQAEAPGAPT